MKSLLLSSAFIGLFCALAFGQSDFPNANWKAFHSDEAGFTIEFPKPPVRSTDANLLPTGRGLAVEFRSVLNGVGFLIVVAEYSAAPPSDEKTRNAMYDSSRDGIASLANTKIRSDRKITVAGDLCRDLEIESSDGLLVTQRACIFGKRFYQLIVYRKLSLADDREINKAVARFMDSLQFSEK